MTDYAGTLRGLLDERDALLQEVMDASVYMVGEGPINTEFVRDVLTRARTRVLAAGLKIRCPACAGPERWQGPT